jgi:hypothetical protein
LIRDFLSKVLRWQLQEWQLQATVRFLWLHLRHKTSFRGGKDLTFWIICQRISPVTIMMTGHRALPEMDGKQFGRTQLEEFYKRLRRR